VGLSMSGELWAVSCHFNPCRYASRVRNHRLFHERLGVPLLTVEASFDGEFELDRNDAEQLVRLRGSDILWQKERLLNLGIAALPDRCDKVAWLDADLLFERPEWPREAADRLTHHSMLQLFSHFSDLPPGVHDAGDPAWPASPSGHSFAYLAALGGHDAELYDAMWGSTEVVTASGIRVERRRNSGLAWAARRDFLMRHGLYDACILGSGDRAIACAAYGRFETSAQNFIRNEPQRRHYFAWARGFAAAVGGRLHYLEGGVAHLWHGELRERGYRERWRDFARFGFDPHVDIAVDDNGCWRWNSEKPEMHAYVASYFASRREDGVEETRSGLLA
jgi:hypothetical protein